MNKKIALISGLAIISLIGGTFVFSNKSKNEVVNKEKEVIPITHAQGETEVPKNPKRVVVFDYATLDAMQHLKIDTVVGLPKDSSMPEYLNEYKAEEYKNVGGLKEPDLEKVNELNPDLIIIAGRQSSYYDKLSEIAPTVSMFQKGTNYMDGFSKNMNIIGSIFGKEEEVERELKNISKRIASLSEQVKENGYSATTLMVSEGSLSAFGENSRFSIIYNNLGFKGNDAKIKSATHGQDVSFEYVSNQDSDYIFVVDKSVISSNKEEKPAKEVLNNELINNTKAAKDNNIIYLDTHSWYLSDGGFTSTNNMIDEIYNAINK